MGFKKGLGCPHAIFCVGQIIDIFVKGGSTVNVCTVDISKAFDKVNFYILLTKLMKRKLPKSLISLLHMWFCCSVFVVKWQGILSRTFVIHCGVRQRGVYSRLLSSLYTLTTS